MTTVSVVVPVYSGEDYLEELIEELGRVRRQWQDAHPEIQLTEVILVDDDSIDGSSDIARELTASHVWVETITLSRNFGQHPATICGILHASGDWIVTMDEDLQHPPAAIIGLLRRAVTEHVDIVYAAPSGPVHDSWRRDIPSRLFKRILAWLARNPAIQHFSSFRLCRGEVARAGASVAGHETYLDVALTWFTDRYAVEHMPLVDRRFQEGRRSGYDLGRLLSHARRLVVSSHTRLMRLAAGLGALAATIAAVFGGRILWSRAIGGEDVYTAGWPSLFVAILFFGGLSAFLLVVVLEYLINVTLHTQGKPTFFAVDRSADDRDAAALGLARGDAVPR